jgi:hypothetical protein
MTHSRIKQGRGEKAERLCRSGLNPDGSIACTSRTSRPKSARCRNSEVNRGTLGGGCHLIPYGRLGLVALLRQAPCSCSWIPPRGWSPFRNLGSGTAFRWVGLPRSHPQTVRKSSRKTCSRCPYGAELRGRSALSGLNLGPLCARGRCSERHGPSRPGYPLGRYRDSHEQQPDQRASRASTCHEEVTDALRYHLMILAAGNRWVSTGPNLFSAWQSASQHRRGLATATV